MTIQEIFDLAIKMGRQADPRPEEEIEKQLARVKHNHDALPDNQKEYFPKDKLINPYLDSAIHYVADLEKEIKKILVTIDPNGADMILARELEVDLVMVHHPFGKSLALLDENMEMQLYVYKKYGIPINIIEGLMRKRIQEVGRSVHMVNQYLPVDTARLLNISLVNIHSPADNLLDQFLVQMLTETKPEFVEDITNELFKIPEFQESSLRGTPTKIFAGSPKNYCGKIMVDMTGGTTGSENIYPHMANAGIGTILTMHRPENHIKIVERSYINMIVTPHIASDSLGMNFFIDELEKNGIEILTAGGFIRVSRVLDKKGKIINPIE